MTFTARTVKDRVVQYPRRYQLVLVEGTTDTYDLIPVTGTVTEVGTAVNKAYLQPIENALAEADSNLTGLLSSSGVNGRAFFTASGTFTAEKTGLHRIICQGAGGEEATPLGEWRGSGGGAGATCIGYASLVAGQSYSISIDNACNVNSAGEAKFNDTLIANNGRKGEATSTNYVPLGGEGGKAEGGILNLAGGDGADFDKYMGNGKSAVSFFGPSYGTNGTGGFVLIEW
jgi:hypothetical protein